MRRIIVSSNIWTVCMRSFTTTHLRAWSSATVLHNRFAHILSKGDKEDVNQVEKAIMRGDSRVLSTAAVKTTKDPKKRDADTGRDPQHNIVTTQEDNKKDTKQKEEKSK
ncbi:uncharacterized protein LOC131029276 [Cryptomeria japonica]|uniref:uncharacterized protein LOC131029276 n=1 Tax=Cryptomeria japonica TaxID=3369 RepID=UPI0025AD2FBF|nr:uncharacterized protein LOC131029276 [Cryptomeria japonica]